MAIQTGSVTSNGSFSDVTVKGIIDKSSNITWEIPTLQEGATITSIKLTGSLNINMEKYSAIVTINGTEYTSSSSLNINLGTTLTDSLSVAYKGSRALASGTISISNIVYTVNYQIEVLETVHKIFKGTIPIVNVTIGENTINKIAIGDTIVFKN